MWLRRIVIAVLCMAGPIGVMGGQVPSEEWTLERLYRRPYLWGTPPQSLQWSEQGHVLAFLWNERGHRFRDLYAYHADRKRLVRLSNLEDFRDPLLLSRAETDEVRKFYPEPQAGISAYVLSRDGRKAAFVFRGDIFVVPTDGSSAPLRLTRTRAIESNPQFSPDGERLAYEREGQLFIHDLRTGQIWQVTSFESSQGTLVACSWAPDGARFACWTRSANVRQLPLGVFAGRLLETESLARTLAGDEPVPMQLFLIDAKGEASIPLPLAWEGRFYGSQPVWSKDGRYLAIRLVHASMKRQRLVTIDARQARVLWTYEESDPCWVYWSEFGFSPDGSQLWFVSEGDGWAHIYRAPVTGGPVEQVTRGPFEARPESLSFDREAYGPQWLGDYIYYQSTEDGPSERHFYRIRPNGTDKQRLSEGEGIHVGLVTQDERYIAWLRATTTQPADLWVGNERVTRRVQPSFEQYPWPRVRFVQFPSHGDRKPVAAKLLLPPGYELDRREGRLWPAIFFVHGAGYATSVLKQWGSYHEERYVLNCYLANRGFVIVDVDYRGSSGYGRTWRTDVYLHLGGLDLEDLLGAVDYLRSLGNIDVNRIGIWGVSYGGFLTNMAMFLAPEVFRAGVAWAAVNDWHNYNAVYTRQRLNTPRENPEAYRRSSPIFFSGMLKNPLLIVHGMLDRNVLVQDAVHLTDKLVREGKRFVQVYYPQEDHGFVREETWIDASRRTVEWFEQHLR